MCEPALSACLIGHHIAARDQPRAHNALAERDPRPPRAYRMDR